MDFNSVELAAEEPDETGLLLPDQFAPSNDV